MNLVGFSVAADCIALLWEDRYLDLHNCFDFQGLRYIPLKQTLVLSWRKSEGSWIKETEPSEIDIAFSDVHLFKLQERNSALPYSEDACLSSIGFMWNDMVNTMQGYTSNLASSECSHLVIEFMSGLCIKVGAKSALLYDAGV